MSYLDVVTRKIARFGAAYDASVLDRSDSLALFEPGLLSANRSARLLRARDGWLAANLPREEDRDAVPALLNEDARADPWDMLSAHAVNWRCDELVSRAETIGIALARVGETAAAPRPCAMETVGERAPRDGALRVLDFSSLWAGPLCGSVFAAMGADVLKIESKERPDPTPRSAPALNARLNGAKRVETVPIASDEGRTFLFERAAQSAVLITSARQRALSGLGLTRERVFSANPALIWVAVTGHGWRSNRIAFGDDAAASGGLVGWESGEPRFIGDALADPLTGLAAAAAALDAIEGGEAGFIDAALAQTAAHVAAGGRS